MNKDKTKPLNEHRIGVGDFAEKLIADIRREIKARDLSVIEIAGILAVLQHELVQQTYEVRP